MDEFTASDGARIAYRDEGSGTPVVLLHGLMAHGGFFREQAALATDFRIITVDLRGHGASAGNGAPPTVERMAADVAELAESLGLQGAIGVGWSLGATVLWHVLAGPASDRFAGAVVVDMTARVKNDAEWDLGLSPEACEARGAAIRDDYESFALSAGQAIFAQPVMDGQRALADWAAGEFAKGDAGAMASVWQSLVRQDVRGLLEGIRHPTLIVHGALSSLYGEDTADHLVAALPQARAVRFERSGHAPHLEEPELFNRTLKDFADGLSPARFTQQTHS
ncbi:MAG TPA: alpha/beta hydrolase [Allosphingosinicella sp.]|nr:alpha/beta hydrolase [Allosphingosinicella sp.]